ncbi:MAG: glycosyltransferase, partial [Verrucomicrobia bacterium]|nr:glycosyltransferase [Verrucomicrobiota bacterium]
AWARLSATFLAGSVPFLLFARQGRSYPAAMLLTMIVLPVLFRPTRMNLVMAVLGLGAMFHLNYIVFAGFFCGLVLALWRERKNIPASHLAVAAAALALLVAPGFWWYRIASRAGLLHGDRLPVQFGRNVVSLLQFALPLPLLAVLLLRWRRRPGAAGEPLIRTLLVLLAGNVLGVTLAPQEYFRYLVHLLPLCAIVSAWGVRALWPVHRPAAVLLGLLLGLTNWLHLLPLEWIGLNRRPWHNDPAMLTSPNIPLKLFWTELRDGYPDVNAALIAYLRAEARPGDTVLATYGDLPLQFYTRGRILGGFQGEPPEATSPPDWVIVRRRTWLTRDDRLPAAVLFAGRLPLDADYEPVVLPVPDEPFGNRPDPYYHHFIPPREPYQHAVLYRKRTRE